MREQLGYIDVWDEGVTARPKVYSGWPYSLSS